MLSEGCSAETLALYYMKTAKKKMEAISDELKKGIQELAEWRTKCEE